MFCFAYLLAHQQTTDRFGLPRPCKTNPLQAVGVLLNYYAEYKLTATVIDSTANLGWD